MITWIFIIFSCNRQYLQINVSARNISVSDSINQLDSEVVKIYLPYKKMIEKEMSRVISVSNMEMAKDKPESKLTNFLADLLLEQGKKEATEEELGFQPDVSYFNYGGIHSFLPKGEITVEKIYELMPFENKMVFLKLYGYQLQEFFNIIAEKGGDSIGGAQFLISGNRAKNIMINGESLNTNRIYWLVTNDYVARGGDNLSILTQTNKIVESDKKIRDVIISYMEEKQENGEKLSAQKDGRIRYE